MSSLDYSTFSLCSALIPSQPAPTRSYPADPSQQHVAEDVIDSRISNTQRDDLLSSSDMNDYPREVALTLSRANQVKEMGATALPFPSSPLSGDSYDDVQGNILCAQLGDFHFTTQFGSGEHGGLDEQVNAPTAINETCSRHSLHYPTPAHGSVSQCIRGVGPIAEVVRPGPSTLHRDVSARVRSSVNIITAEQLERAYDLGLTNSPSSVGVDVATFIRGGSYTSPSPPSASYHDEDFSGVDCGGRFNYAEQLPLITGSSARETASHHPLDHPTVQPFCGFQEASVQHILSLDHRFATAITTPFPGYSPSQSQHDHPVCEPSPSFGTAIDAELPRPGSAPPLIDDNQVPFIGDSRAEFLHSPENAATGEHVTRVHAWHPQPPAPSTGPSPRSSPRRAGSIGHNSQKTPPCSRHLRRWSSVTNPALRASPPSSFASTPPNMIPPFSGYPQPVDNNSYSAHFSPSAESESDDQSLYGLPHAAAEAEAASAPTPSDQQPQQSPPPPIRHIVRCDGHLVDEESWSAALQRPDQTLHVYECFWDLPHSPCGMWIEGDQSSVADHLSLCHGFRGGEVTTRCLWRDCPKPHMKGTSIARHVVTHIGFRVKCNTCKHEFARVDACNRAHSRSGCLGVGQPMYGDLQRVLDARKVDPLQRPSKKRRTED